MDRAPERRGHDQADESGYGDRRRGDDPRQTWDRDQHGDAIGPAGEPLLVEGDDAHDFGHRERQDAPIGSAHVAHRERHQNAEERPAQHRDQGGGHHAGAAGDCDRRRIGAYHEENDLAEVNDPAIADLQIEADRQDERDARDRHHVDAETGELVHWRPPSVQLTPHEVRSGARAGPE